jgi:hypothetical protein
VTSDQADFDIQIDDLKGAIKAEVTGYFHSGHIGTSERLIQVNGGAKVALPTSEINRSRPDCYFRYTFGRPSAEIALKDLKEGTNRFTFSVGPQVCYAFNWPCWGFHTFIVRVYYDQSKAHPQGRIVAPASGASLVDDSVPIETVVEPGSTPLRSVDVLGYYYDYPFEGSGKYLDWHYMIKERGSWSGFIGRTTAPPHRVTWKLNRVPDQEEPIRLMARITDEKGMSYMTAAVDKLSLVRKRYSVKLYKSHELPENFMSRIGKTVKSSFEPIGDHLSQAIDAQLASIIAVGHLERKYLSMCGLNDLRLRQYTGLGDYRTDFFYDPYMPIGLGALKAGANDFFIYSNTEGHMTEVCWPGPALLVTYDRSLPARTQRRDQPTYPPDSGPYYDTESLPYNSPSKVTLVAIERDRAHLIESDAAGGFIEFTMYVPKPGTYDLKAGYFRHRNSGATQLSIEGVDLGSAWDQSTNAETDGYSPAEVHLGTVRLSKAGNHQFRVRSVANRHGSTTGRFTVSYFHFELNEQAANAPSAPHSLTAIPIDKAVIQLKWTDAAVDEDGFSVERRVGLGPWVQIDQVPSNTTMYVNLALDQGVPYTYRVRAYNQRGHSAYSAEAASTTFSYRR